ncbi:efflux RND transporter periplasmic adaptor subunit [Dyadobacter sp. CY323]|uniref:efflux RND transporter periplasmic adaptor subunit n=1 Tax=Dyadobacter sp. CY323 TaxID=2907302 RepID=UPI001F1CB8C5|nr:efflux RND transporter periplasmic adaptor subunit [Dyadobacter sp. CY323]MCE6988259.1 efflux RND transporter periplasmic adaptor subunit [Dyadobacter sp. CY323]
MDKTIHSAKIVSGLIITGVILLSVFIKGYTSEDGVPKKAAVEVSKPSGVPAPGVPSTGVPVDGQVLRSESLNDEMTVSGTLLAYQDVSITSELNRKVVSVLAKEGKFVTAGTLLFKLDDSDLIAEMEQLKQQEKLVILNEKRFKELIDNEAAKQQDYDEAFTNLKVLQAKIDQLKVAISKTSIRAPFSGHLGIVNVHTGAYVTPGSPLAQLTDNSKLKIDFAIPEKHANTLKTGDEIEYHVESDEKAYKAKIIAHDAGLDQQTRTLLMRAVSNNSNRELLPGQSARLTLRLSNTGNALMVPNQALIPSSKGYSVYVVNNHKASFKSIEVGQRNAFSVHVIKGLAPGDTVVTSNMLRLTPGSDVQLVSVH